MITYVSGDLLASVHLLDAIAHGVNCQRVMGAGIALAIRNRYPSVYRTYVNADMVPGDMLPVEANGIIVYNLASQYEFGDARLEWVSKSMNKMIRHAREIGISNIGINRIASDLGGLNWNDVRALIESLDTEGINLYVFEEFVPNQAMKPL